MVEEFLKVEIIKKEGKKRVKKSLGKIFLCPGITSNADPNSPIKYNEKLKTFYIDKNRCIKCFLCVANSKNIHLDGNNFPYLESKIRNSINLVFNLDDYIFFEMALNKFREPDGLSKWVYTLFRIFGFEVFKEVSIDKDTIPMDILKAFGKDKKGVYGKSVIADLELEHENKIYVFECKLIDPTTDTWIEEALIQIALYSTSNIYKQLALKKDVNVRFVFCYNNMAKNIITEKVRNILEKNSRLKNILKENLPKNEFIIINTYELYNILLKNLDPDKKDKNQIMNLLEGNIFTVV
jgi:hypothetical protein